MLLPADLCSSSEEKQQPSAPGADVCCSDPGDSEEAKPHSYLEAICSGLEEPGAGGSPGAAEQLCPYAAAGTCHFGERCLYLHGQLCEICGLQVLHPFDQEQRKAHEMVKEGWESCSAQGVPGAGCSEMAFAKRFLLLVCCLSGGWF